MLKRLTETDERNQFQSQFYYTSSSSHHFKMKIKKVAFPGEKSCNGDESFDCFKDSMLQISNFLVKKGFF